MFHKTALYQEEALALPEGPFKIASILLAGGEGSRLGCTGPKGFVEIAPGLSLFRHWWERGASRAIFSAVMTGQMHTESVKEHFKGFADPIPMIAPQTAVLQKDGRLVSCGNGDFYRWMVFGSDAEVFLVGSVDNPFVDPIDPKLASLVIDGGHDLVVRVLDNATPSMGRLYEKDSKLGVAEYLYDTSGASDFGYTGVFACSLDFIHRAAKIELPLHETKSKKEKFIFDAFYLADNPAILISNKHYIFNPIKNSADLERIIMLFDVK